MGVALSKLVKQISYMKFHLVAGEKGLSNEVRWFHMVESDTISAFLQGGELIFTTGLGLNDQLTLEKLVKEVYHMHASGIVINLGPYIEKIDDSIIQFANEHDFPVFETPWETRMAEIIHIFSFSIIKEEQEKIELSVNLSNALSFQTQKDMYAPYFNKKGFLTDWRYTIATFHLQRENKKNVLPVRYEKISSRINSFLQYKEYDKILCTALENEIVLVFADTACENTEKTMEYIINNISYSLHSEEKIISAVGNCQNSLLGLKDSFEYAEKIINLLKKEDLMLEQHILGEHRLLSFRELGLFKVLLTLDDKSVISEYVSENIQAIYEYDKMNDGDLIVVLESYLRHNGSLKEVADELIIHKNTVNYKIKKIENILGKNLSDLSIRFELMMGLMLKKIM